MNLIDINPNAELHYYVTYDNGENTNLISSWNSNTQDTFISFHSLDLCYYISNLSIYSCIPSIFLHVLLVMGWWDIVCEWHNANEAKFNFQFSLPSITMNDFPYFFLISISQCLPVLYGPFFSLSLFPMFLSFSAIIDVIVIISSILLFFTDWLKRINFPCLPYSCLKQENITVKYFKSWMIQRLNIKE